MRAIALAVGAMLHGCVIITAGQERERTVDVEDSTDTEDATWIAISAGYAHACALHRDGNLECWGHGDWAQTEVPEDTFFSAVAAGGDHTCGLKKEPALGEPICWGRNNNGQVTDTPSEDFSFVQISAGLNHTCGVDGKGIAACWGSNDDGQTNVAPGRLFKAIAAGRYHTCGILDDGSINCWGANTCGQSTPPTEPRQWEQIAAGEMQSCAMDVDGEIACWGAIASDDCNDYGQTDVIETHPDETDDPWVYKAVTAGYLHSCGLSTIGEPWCWGNDSTGAVRLPEGFTYELISAGSDFTIGLADDQSIQCSGSDTQGQCDVPTILEDTDASKE
jgi:alpha-tubulin suppressor-like RCC1 family protein